MENIDGDLYLITVFIQTLAPQTFVHTFSKERKIKADIFKKEQARI